MICFGSAFLYSSVFILLRVHLVLHLRDVQAYASTKKCSLRMGVLRSHTAFSHPRCNKEVFT